MENEFKEFYENYEKLIGLVKTKTAEAIETLKEVKCSNPPQESLNKLERIKQALFQFNYLLIKNHLMLPNNYSWTTEQTKLLSEYESAARQASKAVKKLDDYLKDFPKQPIQIL